MTSQAQKVAQELGDILPNDEKLQAEIQRLNRKNFIPLEQVKTLHEWVDGWCHRCFLPFGDMVKSQKRI